MAFNITNPNQRAIGYNPMGLSSDQVKGQELDLHTSIQAAAENNLMTKGIDLAVVSFLDEGEKKDPEELRVLFPETSYLFQDVEPMSLDAAYYISARAERRHELEAYTKKRNDTLSLRSGIGGASLAGLEKASVGALSFITENLDPSLLIPVLGQTAKGAGLLSKATGGRLTQATLTKGLGTVKGRIATGAIEGAVGGALVSPIEFNYAQTFLGQSGYEAAAASVFGGALFGTGMGTLFGGFRQMRVSKEAKEAMYKVGIDPSLPTKEALGQYADYLTNTEAFVHTAARNSFFKDLNTRIDSGKVPSAEELLEVGAQVDKLERQYGAAIAQEIPLRELRFTPDQIGEVYDEDSLVSFMGAHKRSEELSAAFGGFDIKEGLTQKVANYRLALDAYSEYLDKFDGVDLDNDLGYQKVFSELADKGEEVLDIHKMLMEIPELSRSNGLHTYMQEAGSDYLGIVDTLLSDHTIKDRPIGGPLSEVEIVNFLKRTAKKEFTTEKEKLLSRFLSAFGRELVVTPYLGPHGQVSPTSANTVFVSQKALVDNIESGESTVASMTQIVGHEFWHTLELLNPNIARNIVKQIVKGMSNDELVALGKIHLQSYKKMADANLAHSHASSEYMADVVGHLVNTERFWEKLTELLNKKQGKQVKSAAARWFHALADSEVLSIFKNSFGGRLNKQIDGLAETLSHKQDEIKNIDEELGLSPGMLNTAANDIYSDPSVYFQLKDLRADAFKQLGLKGEDYVDKSFKTMMRSTFTAGNEPKSEDAFTQILNDSVTSVNERLNQLTELTDNDFKNELFIKDQAFRFDQQDYRKNSENMEGESALNLPPNMVKMTGFYTLAHKNLTHMKKGSKVPSGLEGQLAANNLPFYLQLVKKGINPDDAATQILGPQYEAQLRKEALNQKAQRKFKSFKTKEELMDFLSGGYTKDSDGRAAGLSVARQREVERSVALAPLYQSLVKHDLANKWDSSTNDAFVKEVVDVLEGGKSTKASVNDVSSSIKTILDYQGARLKSLGVITDTIEGYSLKGTHNRAVIRNNKENWMSTVKPLLDWQEISKFKKVSTAKDRDNFLNGVFDELKRAQDIEDFIQGLKNENEVSSDIIIAASHFDPDKAELHKDELLSKVHRSLRFLKGKQYEYDKTSYGSGNPAKKLLTNIMLTADKIAVHESLGFNWDQLKASTNLHDPQVNMVFDYITGFTDTPVNKRYGRIRQTASQLTDLAMLWRSGLTSATSDPAHMVSTLRYLGVPMKQAYHMSAKAMKQAGLRNKAFHPNSSEAVKLKGYGAGLDAWMNAASRKFGGEFGLLAHEEIGFMDNISKKISEYHSKMFVLNGQSWITSVGQEAMVDLGQQMIARATIGPRVNKTFQHVLDRFGVTKEDIPLIREATYRDADGVARIDPNKIKDVKIQDKVRSYLDETMRMGVIEPDARSQAYIRLGFREGTPAGVAVRLVTKYMAFSLAQGRQSYARMLQGFSPEKVKALSQDPRALGNLLLQSNLMTFAGMALVGATANQVISDITKFKEPTIFNTNKMGQILQRAGLIPVIGDVMQRTGADTLMGDDSLFGIGGPTIGTLVNIVNQIGIPFIGDEATSYGVVNSVMQATPGATIPFLGEGRKALFSSMFDSYNDGFQRSLAYSENNFDQTSLFREDTEDE